MKEEDLEEENDETIEIEYRIQRLETLLDRRPLLLK